MIPFAHVIEKARNLEVTKRNVLSLLASLFDPLGIISPVTVSMKALFPGICSNKFDWDKPLMGETKGKWDRWIKDLSETKEIQIDRCLYDVGGDGVEKCYLHRFRDPSKKAYCTTVYFVYLGTDGKTRVRLVASKTRVAPLKELSIPRLELMSARIDCKTIATLKDGKISNDCTLNHKIKERGKIQSSVLLNQQTTENFLETYAK